MSVCYILPEMMRNMRKTQQAMVLRGTNPQNVLIQKLKSVLPVLIPLRLRPDQSMTRSISLQLRGFDNLNWTVRTSSAYCLFADAGIIGLTDWQFFIDWVEDMDEDQTDCTGNLTTRYRGTEQPQLRQISAEVHLRARWLGYRE